MNDLPNIFTSVAPSKSDINEQCQSIINEIVDGGNIDPLKVATTIKGMEEAVKIIKAGIKESVLTEAQTYGKKTFELSGHTIGIRETGVKYDYTSCNDPVINNLIEKLETLNKEIKDRETFLKSIKDSITVVDESTGEVVEVYAPAKSSTTSVTIQLKK